MKVVWILLSVRKASYRYLSAEIVTLKWGSRVRIMFCINKCRSIFVHLTSLSTVFSCAFPCLSSATTTVMQVVVHIFLISKCVEGVIFKYQV